MKTYPALKKQFYPIMERILDFYYNWASSPPGFLRLVLAIRFIVLLIITVNFGYLFSEHNTPLRALTIWVITSYFFFILLLLYQAILKTDQFEGYQSQRGQVVFDGLVTTYLYWVSAHVNNQPDPNIFLLYFLPLLVTARFLRLRAALLLMLYIFFASITIWVLELKNPQLHSFHYWFTNLLPQFGFLLIMTIFYMIYYRRRKMGERLQTMALVLEDQIGQLWQGWFSVDRELKITAMDTAIQQRHSPFQDGLTCAHVFCQTETPTGKACSNCPLNKALTDGKSVTNSEITFTNRDGAKYQAQITAHPILNGDQDVIGVNAWVQDMDERKTFQQRQRMLTDDLERVIDQNRQEDRAHAQSLAQRLETISQASESALSTDLFRGADEIVRAMVLLLGCRLATVRQHQVDENTDQEGLVLCNHFGLDPKDVERIAFLDLNSSSLVVKAYKTGEDQYVEDFQNSGLIKYEELLRRYDLRSMACFPLKIQGKVIGTFTLFRNRRQGFTEGDLQLARALSNIMATLVANQRQFARDQQESQRRKLELNVLSSLSQKLVTLEGPNSLAQLVADTVRTELHAETAAVFLKKDGILYRSAISGLESDWFTEESYEVGQGITGRAVLEVPGTLFGSRMLDNDVENSGLVLPENLVRYNQRLSSGVVRHLLAVPLNGLEGTFGVLRVVNKLSSQGKLDKLGFSEQETELMTTIACMVAIAMENARLFDLEKKKRLLEQALRQGTRNLSSTLKEHQILDTILKQLRKVVEYDTASLFFQEGNNLRLKSMAGFDGEEAERLRNMCLDPDKNLPFLQMKANHQPILATDLWEASLLDPIAGTPRIRSWIGAPLIFKDQILGWLSVDHWKPNQYSREDVEIAQDFAQQAAIAIDNARQYQAQAEQVTRLMNLEQSLVEIRSAGDKNATMDLVAQVASRLMNCEITGVALYDKKKKEIYALPDAGYVGVLEDFARNFRFPLENSGGKVLKEKRVFTTNDASADPDSIFGQKLVTLINVRGVIASPLMAGEHIVGVLYAATRMPRNWTDSEMASFSILSNHAAVAIRNSELMYARERRAQLLDLLHHLSIAGQLTNDPEVIYNILLTAVTAEYGLRFNRALLLLYDKDLNVLKGFTGIGQLDNSDAYNIWETLDDHSHSFEGYIQDVLSRGVMHYTALHYKAKNLEIPVRADAIDIFSRVFRTGKILKVDPTDEHELMDNEFYRIFDTKLFVLVPLVVNNEVVGVLAVDNKMNSEPIQQMELDLLESCASQAAAAIYRSNLHQQVEDRVHVMEHLQELTQAFSELAEPREVLRRIAVATNDVLHADVAYLVPYDPETDELLVEQAVTAGAETDFQHEGTFSIHGLTSLAKQEPGGLVVIEDLKSRKDLRSRFAEQEGVHSVAVCRLELRKKVVGMLYVNYRRAHWFNDFELNTLRMLAGQAAVAVNNAHLLLQNEALATQRERNRLREDLHDVLNTYAFKVMEPAESIYEKEKGKRRRDKGLTEEAEELWRFSRHIYHQLERILEDMRDSVLVERGLQEAVRSLIHTSGLPGVDLTIRGIVRPSADVELVLYRICQEAISNIHKHAKLPKTGIGLANIVLELEAGHSRLMVQDFGVGFSPALLKDHKKGMGLQAIQNWARKVSALINIKSNPGEGTLLEVVVPTLEKENAK